MTGGNQNERKNRPKKSRRNILKVAGVTAASLVGVSTMGSVSAQSRDGPDTDFNPKNRDEVVGFLNDVDEKPEEQHQEYAKELSKRQKQAIGDLYANVEWEYSTQTEGVVKTQSGYEPEKETTTATGKVLGFGPVYDHIQILEWEHNGDEYRNADQTLDYNLKGPFATFKGKTKDEIDGNGYEFTATLKAKYAASIGGVERGGEAVIKTTGDATGDFAVDKKKAPTG